MTHRTAAPCFLILSLALAAPAAAQSSGGTAATPPSQSSTQTASTGASSIGPATQTAAGDTGLFVVPTSNVLPAKTWAVSFFRTNADDGQGFSDISTFPLNVAVGLANRVEVFGSWTTVVRIDRDTRPLFFTNTPQTTSTGTGGGILVDYPLDRSTWIGNARGDLRLGAKFALLSQADGHPVGFAVRPIVKLPIGNDTLGASSGKADVSVDGVLSKDTHFLSLSGYGGVIVRGNPAGYTLTNGFEWGAGAGVMPSHRLGLILTGELYGEQYFNNTITAPAGLFGEDGSAVPTSSDIKSPAFAAVSLTWEAPNGFYVGAAASINLHMDLRSDAQSTLPGVFSNYPWDRSGFEVRLGYHPGARGSFGGGKNGPSTSGPGGKNNTQAGPAGTAGSTPGGAPPASAGPGSAGPGGGAGGTQTGPGNAANAPANRPPTVKAMCDPCTVEVGKTSTVSADAQDPDGDPLTYRWTAPLGTFANSASRQTLWTAPMQVGPVRVTVGVDDGKGGTASDAVTIQVVKQAELVFEDVNFDFNRFSLRDDALKVLDGAVTALQANPALRITIEGYTCNIGTAEYNLALGERRAQAVKDYLVSRGIDASRLTTVSYGEERPKYDNSREETRRLNRRAALVVKIEGQ